MPVFLSLGTWLVGHQAIVAAIGIYFGAAAAGVDLVDKAIKLERDVVHAEHVMPAAAPSQPGGEEPGE